MIVALAIVGAWLVLLGLGAWAWTIELRDRRRWERRRQLHEQFPFGRDGAS